MQFLFNIEETGMVFYKECLRLTEKHKNEYDTSKVLAGLGRVVTNIKVSEFNLKWIALSLQIIFYCCLQMM